MCDLAALDQQRHQSRGNRWNTSGQGGVEVRKGALRRPARQVSGRARGGSMKSALRHGWHRILLNDAPIAVEKSGGACDGEQ